MRAVRWALGTGLLINKITNLLDPQLRLVFKGHVTRVGQDNQLRSAELLLRLESERRVALVVIAGDDQRRYPDGGQAIEIFDGSKIAIDNEFAVGAPHFAVEFPVSSCIGRCRVVSRIRSGTKEEREIAIAPSQLLIFLGVAALLPSRSLSIETGLLQRLEAGKFVRRQVRFFAREDLVHFAGLGGSGGKNEVTQVLVIRESVKPGRA